MPKWIHERAEHLLAKNPSMKKEHAFGIATQQAHATGKAPKGFGTPEGKTIAKLKFDKPKKEYVKTPNPRGLKTKQLSDKPTTKWTGSKLVPVKEKKSAAMSAGEFLSPAQAKLVERHGAGVRVKGETKEEAKRQAQRKLISAMKAEKTASDYLFGGFLHELQKIGKYLHEQLSQSKTKDLKAPPPNKEFQVKQGEKKASLGATLATLMKQAATPAGILSSSQKVGKPSLTPAPGPSIAQQTKPIGFGKPLSGAKKGNNII